MKWDDAQYYALGVARDMYRNEIDTLGMARAERGW